MLLWLTIFGFLLNLRRANGELTIGNNFVIAFPCFSVTFVPSVLIVNTYSNQDATVTITSSVLGFATMRQKIARNSASQISFTDPHVLLGMRVCDREIAQQRGFQIVTSVPVALYANLGPKDGSFVQQFMVLPTNMLDFHYAVQTEAIIVATKNGTQMTVDGISKQVTLNQYDVYLTSRKILSSNAPFAYILLGPGRFFMALPNSYASTRSTITPVRCYNYWEIFAFEDNTEVSINGNTNATVSTKKSYDVEFGNTGGTILASKPVQAFFSNYGLGYANVPEAYLSSSIQFFPIGSNSNPPTLVIVAPALSTGSILLDGQAIPALQYQPIPYSQEYYYTQAITGSAKLHTISTATAGDRYMAYIYYTGVMTGMIPLAFNMPPTAASNQRLQEVDSSAPPISSSIKLLFLANVFVIALIIFKIAKRSPAASGFSQMQKK